MSIDKTLEERGKRYGSFEHHARIVQELKAVVMARKGYENLEPYMKQALDVIFDKIARMLNGDPYYLDNWHDIQGYAKLVEDIISGNERTSTQLAAGYAKLQAQLQKGVVDR